MDLIKPYNRGEKPHAPKFWRIKRWWADFKWNLTLYCWKDCNLGWDPCTRLRWHRGRHRPPSHDHRLIGKRRWPYKP